MTPSHVVTPVHLDDTKRICVWGAAADDQHEAHASPPTHAILMSAVDMAFDGGLASAVATLVSNPFDVMRIRMQLQGERQVKGSYTALYTNLPQGLYRVAREEGLTALETGLGPALLWQVTQNSIRIGLYPLVKDKIAQWSGRSDGTLVGIAAAMTCGTVGCIAASPFQMVKTRLQAQHRNKHGPVPASGGRVGDGAQQAYKNVADALRRVYTHNGLHGLWQGCEVAVQRTLIFSPAQLVSYDLGKRHAAHYLGLPPSDTRVHIAASVFSSLMITFLTNPVEVVMTRTYNRRQDAKSGAAYSSNVAVAILQVYRVEGVHGLYKGSTALFWRTLPHTVTTFLALEAIRKFRERYTTRAYTSGTAFRRE